ncbi:MAG: carbamoyltransferase HypF [Desulfovibrionaceae bacterium]|nr:carbamoyltransferase HypF [Desulfovibrionaceae bacterium]MBF0513366.1 carbamoyltransferase HypF [Desulfovibrionaceae bacterium]
MPDSTLYRRRLTIAGQVQGVGFRPFVYRLAGREGLTGFAFNDVRGVVVELQGSLEALGRFGAGLTGEAPPLARIVTVVSEDVEPVPGETAFGIRQSLAGTGHAVLIAPDTAVCPDCLAEMFNPANRRYLYPFTNCTNCGPRHTITRTIPYDRPGTSMACFPLCPACEREYRDPADRRFHAQPNACPECGPHVRLADASGATLAERGEALERCARLLAGGNVVAVKGLGGFHLCCDAASDAAVARLRARKGRPNKPLAVMVADAQTAKSLARVDEASAALLTGHIRPIVLCRAIADAGLSALIAPDTDALGLMLPYTPLHQVLFHHYRRELRSLAPGRTAALVMTSGNISGEPICLGNREAARRLGAIADAFLFHNRDILIRTDDSVVRCLPAPDGQPYASGAPPQTPPGGMIPPGPPQRGPGAPAASGAPGCLYYRRARGYVPGPVFLAGDAPPVLGLGPLLKCTVTLTKGDRAFVSQHIGDLENLETYAFYRETIAHMRRVLTAEPVLAVRDAHPDYLSSRHAAELGIPAVELQHHFAHIHAVLAEHRFEGPALGLALDGSGYGLDGTVWGGEGLYVHPRALVNERLGRLTPVAMPGGEAAIREPWRMAQSYLAAIGEKEPSGRAWTWLEGQKRAQASRLVGQMLEKGVNCPRTSSCGRLFDAVAGLLGLSHEISYEGQAAIVLERVQDASETHAYEASVARAGELLELDSLGLFAQVLADWRAGVPAPRISRRFHLGLIAGLVRLAGDMAEATGIATVGLSGGAMQNFTLATRLPRALRLAGLTALRHEILPPGDACISLGQAAYGRMALCSGQTGQTGQSVQPGQSGGDGFSREPGR